MISISNKCLQKLQNGKNLLAFSHGVDSTALFYILQDLKIEFDIAIVNYNTRENSNLEEQSAKKLATKYNKKCFSKSVKLENKNFENQARKIRYSFFEEICITEKYTNLILAHQINDMFEWFLMQLSKGAGLNELIGMQEIEKNKNYTLLRPILNTKKDELINFLEQNRHNFFIDESNFSKKYKRNEFRLDFSDKFIQKYANGVKKSFEFLRDDLRHLKPKYKIVKDKFYIVKKDINAIRGIDKVCKNLGVLMSEKQRKNSLQNGVISGKIAIGVMDDFILVSPFTKTIMTKKFKEKCRKFGIPNLVRPYLFDINFEIDELEKYLSFD